MDISIISKLIATLKISIATILAIILANLLNLENIFSAGIVTILSIQPTKKETLKTAIGRCLAFVIALIIAFCSFNIIGYNQYGFFIFLIIFVLVCQLFGWLNAMAMNSVIILHFIGFGNMSIQPLLNEIAIFSIGIISGIVANLHLHKDTKSINRLIAILDEQIVQILSKMSDKLVQSDKSDYNGQCFLNLSKSLKIAETKALENFANQFSNKDFFDINYVNMRRKQEYVLMEMYKNVRQIDATPETIYPISIFIKNISVQYDKNNDVSSLLNQLIEIKKHMKSTELPQNRIEFENRARLYVLLQQIEDFLTIKQEFSLKK